MKFDSLIKSRRSVRKFKSIEPDWRDIIEAIDAARFAPMAGGNGQTLGEVSEHPGLVSGAMNGRILTCLGFSAPFRMGRINSYR